MTVLRSLIRTLEHRDVSFQSVWGSGGPWSGGSKTASGVPVSEEKSLQLTTVYACVSLVSEVIGSLPWDVVRSRGGVREEVAKPAWMEQPNPRQWDVDFKQRTVASLLLWGNSNTYVVRDSTGNPLEVWPLHPGDVRLEESKSRPRWFLRDEPLADHEMLHIPAFGVPGTIKGLSPIGAARQAVGLGLAAEQYGASFFGNGAHPSGVLQSEHNLTDEQAAALSASWKATHGGVNRSNLPAVLEGGLTWKAISVPPEEAQFLQTREFQRSEICGLYRVPPHMIGDVSSSTSWGTGIEQQSIGFVVYTLTPWIARLERAFSSLLPRGQQVKINVNGLLRGDMQGRAEFYTALRNLGSLSANEIRAHEDMPPIEDESGDIYLQPLNMGRLGVNPLDNPDVPNDPDAEQVD